MLATNYVSTQQHTCLPHPSFRYNTGWNYNNYFPEVDSRRAAGTSGSCSIPAACTQSTNTCSVASFPSHKKSMECSIHVVIKKSDEIVFESSKTASEMKEKNIPQKELQTDSEPLPMLKEGPLYHLTTAIDVRFERLFLISRK